ncbi:Rieske (2Fe-2S) protein [Rhizobium sp. FY34]|uniref:Rieske (2Fe-2S) protein n=1 Tax=Rhizobium sp. FY34 TaxID=2562309 RepID=UPI0010C07D73|nr:Rieske (2Fe-2S) protein [Rhizobium sp. FY34]
MSSEAAWVPVALSASIEPGTSAGAVVEGAELVVWRDAKGVAHVWEDRCPHRGMRMSFGFVRGDHIACLYHGWSYDTAGQCRHIPAHPDLDVPKTIKIATYAVEEAGGVIWTRLATAAQAADPLPTMGTNLPVRSLYADCSAAHALAILKQTQLPVGKDETYPARLQVVTPHAWTLEAGALSLSIAVQVIGPQKIGLHILADEGSVDLIAALARWAQALRLALEAPVTVAEVA